MDEMIDMLSNDEHNLLLEEWSFLRLMQLIEMAPVDCPQGWPWVRLSQKQLLGNFYWRLGFGQQWMLFYTDAVDVHEVGPHTQVIVKDGQLLATRPNLYTPIFDAREDARTYIEEQMPDRLAPYVRIAPSFMGLGKLATNG